eukprot:gb/GEZJ01007292.1/.p1 GENE.gb/GEZJ01007292.1/~~gb/GEZJ01007292.1/.p1  ORF type:complete len:107 (-),score=6.95 gb/GEZJ01007292.1/:400-720(-)
MAINERNCRTAERAPVHTSQQRDHAERALEDTRQRSLDPRRFRYPSFASMHYSAHWPIGSQKSARHSQGTTEAFRMETIAQDVHTFAQSFTAFLLWVAKKNPALSD